MSILHRIFAAAILTVTLPFGAGCIASSESQVDKGEENDEAVAVNDNEEEAWDESDAALVSGGAVGEIVYDGPGRTTFTTCENDSSTHCCPTGFAMTGIHVGDNVFRCVRTIKYTNLSRQQCGFDTGTAATVTTYNHTPTLGLYMHVCPTGKYMRGVNLAANRFICCNDTANTSYVSRELELYSTDPAGYMRACPNATWAASVPVMSGYHGSQNALSCSSYPNYL